MNRLIVPKRTAGPGPLTVQSNVDDAITRLVKYIPAEVISGYTMLSGIVAGVAPPNSPLKEFAGWAVFAIFTGLTPIYLWKVGRPTGVQWWHLPISTVSFVLWAYALGGPFTSAKIFGLAYESWFAALLAGLFSWAIAIVWTPTEPQPSGIPAFPKGGPNA
ncbi:MAG: hypothetical protein WDO69_18835 [Pseudomonadota bacterium]